MTRVVTGDLMGVGKIRKGSKTTYADFCEKHGIVWAEKEIPTDWLK